MLFGNSNWRLVDESIGKNYDKEQASLKMEVEDILEMYAK